MPGFGQPYPGADHPPPAGPGYAAPAGAFGGSDPGHGDFGGTASQFGGDQFGTGEPGGYGDDAGGYGGGFRSGDQPHIGQPEHDFAGPEIRPPYDDSTLSGRPFAGAAEPGYEHGTDVYSTPSSGFGPPDYSRGAGAGAPPAPPDVPVGMQFAPPHIAADPSALRELRDRPYRSPRSDDPPALAGGTRTGAFPTAEGTARMPRPRVGRSGREDPNAGEARVNLSRVEPLSVLKFSFVLSVVAFIVLFVAVAVLYGVLAGLGVFDSLQQTISSLTSGGSGGPNVGGWFSASRILGYAALFGAINIVLITALSTVGAVLYNAAARLIGGVEVTLNETE
jgi:membrane-associated protease RseP (regulator of RpoE activity)